MQTAKLVPVSEWVYDLYKVSYWTGPPELDGKLISTKDIAATDNHIEADANEHAPARANWMTWDVVKENVGHPGVIGHMHGHDMYEDALSFGKRIMGKM